MRLFDEICKDIAAVVLPGRLVLPAPASRRMRHLQLAGIVESSPKPKVKKIVKQGPPQIVYYKDAFENFPNDANPIGLQNLNNRAVAYCFDNSENTAESCAQYLESKGYVRFRDIPYKTANYDFLKVDTYPTRRWRDAELTSRW